MALQSVSFADELSQKVKQAVAVIGRIEMAPSGV